ncbi:hypothetical protein EAL2_808p04350 (plasmid) [Peptoclostridium acidaminophilum DSM 3953]|uniref:Lipoprotein n=1 Tax=Peptoclostridium acidaminophilum DSM 3953 TaxID=1286171 RepID=W8T8A2_PEPAC|nr:hypothetical protein [Peptoclostridium acidaminophilum]AHM57939.1 hypothetical protein EAL2_808p04350 [Peptoclostridium acidaminophilum DSM 3953]
MKLMKFNTRTMLTSMVLMAVLIVAGCSRTPENMIKEEKQVTETGTGDAAETPDVDGGTDGQTKWPEDIPSYVPRLPGEIYSIAEEREEGIVTYSIFLKNVTGVDMDSYADALLKESPDWSILSKTELDDGWNLKAIKEGGENDTGLVVSLTDAGKGVFQVSFPLE